LAQRQNPEFRPYECHFIVVTERKNLNSNQTSEALHQHSASKTGPKPEDVGSLYENYHLTLMQITQMHLTNNKHYCN
jgi:hypothetical protein